jgi:hypothetical protein
LHPSFCGTSWSYYAPNNVYAGTRVYYPSLGLVCLSTAVLKIAPRLYTCKTGLPQEQIRVSTSLCPSRLMELRLLCRRQAKGYGGSQPVKLDQPFLTAGAFVDWLYALLCHGSSLHKVANSRLQCQKRKLTSHYRFSKVIPIIFIYSIQNKCIRY